MKKALSIISVFVALCTVLSIGASAFSVTQPIREAYIYTLGDANGDGSVDARDALTIKASIAGIMRFGPADRNAGDINADGFVTAVDCFYLKGYFVNLVNLDAMDGGNGVYKFVIGDTDISEFTFVLEDSCDDTHNAYFAYELLREYIKLGCGVELPMTYGTTSGHGIYFHEVDTDSALGEELGVEGYKYEVSDGDLNIYGTYRGNMYAAYEIIEDYLGFYFCANEYTKQDKVRCANLYDGFSRQFVPPIESRFVYTNFWGSTKAWTYLPRGLNSTANGENSGSRYYGTYTGARYINAHSFYFYECMGAGEMPEEGATKADGTVMTLADRYYAKYEDGRAHGYERGIITEPSKVTETGKQPCATNNEEFQLLYSGFTDTIHMLEARGYDLFFEEGLHFMSFSINDTDPTVTDGGYCTCKFCNAKVNGTTINANSSLKKELEHYNGKYEFSADGRKVTFEPEPYSAIYMDLSRRAAEQIQEMYPGLSVYFILYDHSVPNYIRPSENMVIVYCGNGCNQHPLGSGQCNDTGSLRYDWGFPAMSGKRYTNEYDEYAIPLWSQYCHEVGSKLYFWVYPETYSSLLYDFPNVYNVYYDIQWLYTQGIDGIFYEGSGANGDLRLTEKLKAYLASEVMFDPAMSWDEFSGLIYKYLRAYYGKGYEYIYDYIFYLQEAGDVRDKCAYAAFDLVWDMYSKSYIAEHYETMRLMLTSAIAEEDSSAVHDLLMGCDFLGLSACYDEMYTNGTAESRALYEQRFTDMYNYIKDNNIRIYLGDYYTLPSSISFASDPATQFYKVTSRG